MSIVVLLSKDIAGVLLAFALVVRLAGVEIRPVSIIVLLSVDLTSVLLALALVVGFTSSIATVVLLALALVVGFTSLEFASVLLSLALVMRITSLDVNATGGKSSNKVRFSDRSASLFCISKN
jgi:hypothetical protein